MGKSADRISAARLALRAAATGFKGVATCLCVLSRATPFHYGLTRALADALLAIRDTARQFITREAGLEILKGAQTLHG